jgi:uncharacterized membrane-anchored protein YhcB (DUF1043 family)
MMKYYDATTGTERLKRRYIWASWALVVGFIVGVVVARLL